MDGGGEVGEKEAKGAGSGERARPCSQDSLFSSLICFQVEGREANGPPCLEKKGYRACGVR